MSKLRVLDLANPSSPMGKKWQEFVSSPIPGQPDMNTRAKVIQKQNNMYHRYFKEFINMHGIDLGSYDAIVGPEYVRQGKQICIRNPALIKPITGLQVDAAAIRKGTLSQFGKSEHAPATKPPGLPSAAAVQIKSGLKETLKSGVRAVGPSIAALVVAIGFSWLQSKFAARAIEQGFRKIQPEVERRLGALDPQIKKLRADNPGKPVYAVITVKVSASTVSDDMVHGGIQRPVEVELADVGAGLAKTEGEVIKNEFKSAGPFATILYEHTFKTYSVQLEDG